MEELELSLQNLERPRSHPLPSCGNPAWAATAPSRPSGPWACGGEVGVPAKRAFVSGMAVDGPVEASRLQQVPWQLQSIWARASREGLREGRGGFRTVAGKGGGRGASAAQSYPKVPIYRSENSVLKGI